MENKFWAFSLNIYQAEGVARQTLAAQDQFQLDVNLLLYGAWLASQDRVLTAAHLRELQMQIAIWQGRVVKPLRNLRRKLGLFAPLATLYQQLKVLELQAERQQQDQMWEFFQQSEVLPWQDRPLRENLTLLLASPCAEEELLEPLLAVLGRAPQA